MAHANKKLITAIICIMNETLVLKVLLIKNVCLATKPAKTKYNKTQTTITPLDRSKIESLRSGKVVIFKSVCVSTIISPFGS